MDMKVEPTKQHAWLRKLVGEWTSECIAQCTPDQPPEACRGTETIRAVGDIWIVGDGRGEMPGGAGMATMMLTLGYDPQRERFVGSWIGSMMTHHWLYSGELDAAGKVLTLESEGPDFQNPGKTCRYRDVHTIISDSERTLTGRVLGPDGQWHDMMTATYRRKK